MRKCLLPGHVETALHDTLLVRTRPEFDAWIAGDVGTFLRSYLSGHGHR